MPAIISGQNTMYQLIILCISLVLVLISVRLVLKVQDVCVDVGRNVPLLLLFVLIVDRSASLIIFTQITCDDQRSTNHTISHTHLRKANKTNAG